MVIGVGPGSRSRTWLEGSRTRVSSGLASRILPGGVAECVGRDWRMEPQTQSAETTGGALGSANAPNGATGWIFRSALSAEDREDIVRVFAARRGAEGDRQIKTGRGRIIRQVELGGRSYVAKTIESARLTGFVRRLLHRTAADREWRRAEELERRGIDCVRFIAYRREEPAILLSPFIVGATTLTDAWSNAGGGREDRNALIQAVATAHAALHRVGFVHMDNHPENHLVVGSAGSGGDGPRVVLADVGSIEQTRSRRRQIASLGQAAHAMMLRASTTDRVRFLNAYLAARRTRPGGHPAGMETGSTRSDHRPILRELESAARRHALMLFRKRDRALRHCTGRYFVSDRNDAGATGATVTRWSRRVRFKDPALSDDSREDASRRLGALLRKLAQPADAHDATNPKITEHIWKARSLPEKLAWRLRGSPARRLFEAAHRRRFRDVEHPRVVAFGEYLRGSEYRSVALVAKI